MYIACLVFLAIPFFCHVLNGFSYPVGRWCYALAYFGVINGREHWNGSKYYLKTVVKPVLSSQSEVNKLKNGKLPYDQGKVTKKKVCKKSVTSNKSSNTSNKSLRNDKNIKKYNNYVYDKSGENEQWRNNTKNLK